MAAWTFLTNYGLVLTHIGRHPDSTGREIAQTVGVTERAARKILADLQADGYVEWDKVGRRNRYRVNAHLPLRVWGEGGLTVRALLELLWCDGDRARVAVPPPAATPRSAGRNVQGPSRSGSDGESGRGASR